MINQKTKKSFLLIETSNPNPNPKWFGHAEISGKAFRCTAAREDNSSLFAIHRYRQYFPSGPDVGSLGVGLIRTSAG
jgi:hypothetical protein